MTDAATILAQAIADDPDDLAARAALADLYEEAGDVVAAKFHQWVLESHPLFVHGKRYFWVHGRALSRLPADLRPEITELMWRYWANFDSAIHLTRAEAEILAAWRGTAEDILKRAGEAV